MFSGKLLAIIAATDKSGEVIVKVTSEGLPDAELCFNAEPAEVPEGISFTERNIPRCIDCKAGAAFRGKGAFGFENVDFGNIGSDTVTVPIFADTNKPLGIRFYDGIPGEGGELIGEFKYQKPPVWMFYTPKIFQTKSPLSAVINPNMPAYT